MLPEKLIYKEQLIARIKLLNEATHIFINPFEQCFFLLLFLNDMIIQQFKRYTNKQSIIKAYEQILKSKQKNIETQCVAPQLSNSQDITN